MLHMTLIPTPEWAAPLEVSVDPAFGTHEYERVLAQREAVLATVHAAVQAYVNHERFTSQQPSFPEHARLTGEYYVHDEAYWVIDELWFQKAGRSSEFRFAVKVHCLEHIWAPGQVDQDYLGLSVLFSWDLAAGTYRHDGDVDSSSI